MFSSLVNTLFQLHKDRSYPVEDKIPKEVYLALNWNKTVVAGSYALKQFTGDNNWEPNDIDVMISCGNKDEFLKEAKAFEEKSGALLTKSAWFDHISYQTNAQTQDDDELFHESVLGSRTYKLDNCNLPIQLICLDHTKKEFGSSPQSILQRTTDIPSCVSYSVSNDGQKMFYVPEKGVEILATKRGSKEDICNSRFLKYLTRGYEFY